MFSAHLGGCSIETRKGATSVADFFEKVSIIPWSKILQQNLTLTRAQSHFNGRQCRFFSGSRIKSLIIEYWKGFLKSLIPNSPAKQDCSFSRILSSQLLDAFLNNNTQGCSFSHYLVSPSILEFLPHFFVCLKNVIPLFTCPLQNVSFCLDHDFPTPSESWQSFFIMNVVVRQTMKYSILMGARDSSFCNLLHPLLSLRIRASQNTQSEGNYNYFTKET